MGREPDDDGAMDAARALRILRNRQALKAMDENERSRKKTWPEEKFADERGRQPLSGQAVE